jgi:hypothetical protein
MGILRLDVSTVSSRLTYYGLEATNNNRACSLKGHAPIALIETYQDIDQRIALFARISPTLRFQLKLNGLVVRCTSAVLQNGLRSMSKDQEHSLDVLIRVFEASLRDIERETTSGKWLSRKRMADLQTNYYLQSWTHSTFMWHVSRSKCSIFTKRHRRRFRLFF